MMRDRLFPSLSPRLFVRGSFFVAALCAWIAMTSRPISFAAPAPVLSKSLQIYFVDVEGGQSTLFVNPEGKSLLIDTGWPGNDGRDADRIVAAAKLAGIAKLDFVLLTHYHTDHTGGVPQLAAKIPIGTFIDHGVNREPTDAATEHEGGSRDEGGGKLPLLECKLILDFFLERTTIEIIKKDLWMK